MTPRDRSMDRMLGKSPKPMGVNKKPPTTDKRRLSNGDIMDSRGANY